MCFSCVGWRGDKPWGNARNFSYFSIWFLFVLGFLSQARRSLSAVLYKTALGVYVSTENQTLRGSEKKNVETFSAFVFHCLPEASGFFARLVDVFRDYPVTYLLP